MKSSQTTTKGKPETTTATTITTSKKQICALQSLRNNKTIDKPTSTRTKRTLKEITNISSVAPSIKKKKSTQHIVLENSNEENSETKTDSEITKVRKSLSISIIQNLKQLYERDSDISIITEVTTVVPTITFAREVIGTIGNPKFSSQFLERRTVSTTEEFLSWLQITDLQRSILQKVQFQKADIIMSSTDLTLRVWFTRLERKKILSPKKHVSRG